MQINKTIQLIAGFLVFSVFIFGVNYVLLQPIEATKAEKRRKLASLSGVSAADEDWQKWLKASKQLKREVASIGRNPTEIDKLTSGVLEGKYSALLKKGKLVKIKFSDRNEDRPKYIRNRTDFLNDYRSLLPDFERVKLTEDRFIEDRVTEIYKLYAEDGKESGTVTFNLDNFGRLISLDVRTEL